MASHSGSRRLRTTLAVAGAALLAAGATGTPAPAQAHPSLTLRHASSFFVTDNLVAAGLDPASPTSAEIVDVTPDGRTLLYTDAFTGMLGVVDVRDPEAPEALGMVDLPGDPTSVAIHGRWALVAVVTSTDPDGSGPLNEYDAPSGALAVIEIATRTLVRTIPLPGQPDSVAVAPSGRYAAIVIENERDEDEDDGLIPQPPAGSLQVLDLGGGPWAWGLRHVALTGLADVAPDDPEPEYVDINGRDQAVVSLQENNHLVIVDLRRARVVRDFSAGSVDLDDVDTSEEEIGPQGAGAIELTGALDGRRREPDTVAWIDDDRFATANEGDYEDESGTEGGSRSFTIFDARGRVDYESGNRFEHAVVGAGHYPEARSENKGNEPEGLEVGRVGGRTLLFVASERANIVGVYDVTGWRPVLRQLLPTGIGPEGLKLAKGGLLAVTAEVDGADEGFAARPMITLFSPSAGGDWAYPQIRSANEDGLPIPWVAMSGLAAEPGDPRTLWAVSDSVLGQAWIYRVDVSTEPAVIRQRIPVGATDVADQELGDYDLEGIAARPEGGFWLASEGRTNAGSSRPNLLLRVDGGGAVLGAIRLPASLAAAATSSGLEGVAVTGRTGTGDEVVWVALQRGWGDDPTGHVKIGRYEVATASWSFAHYPLDPVESPAGGWVGLSELTALRDGTLAVIERDNQLGQEARIKRVYAIDPASVAFAAHGSPLPVLGKALLRDVLDELDRASISVPDKLEGMAVTAAGRAFLVTDNDGVDENYGETVFLRLGSRWATGR
jgi:DNA-binding beta-propeller fold protein YncE